MINVALTGASGAMGSEVLAALLGSGLELKIKCVLFDKEKRLPKCVKRLLKDPRVEAFWGDVSRYADCVKLVENADYVINCASLIPPKSDHDPLGTFESNFLGTKNIVDAICADGDTSKTAYIHIATVALYGHRAYPHVWIRVGDPIISSDYDVYSKQKLKAEKYVLESGLKKFVSLRQTAVLHKFMLANNMSDGLMFHTVWNGALEWVTDRDSGRLTRNLLEKDAAGGLENFWNKIYNIGGGESCRITGYESFEHCFSLVGGGVEKYFKPNWNITRNFHGGWFYDSDELENILNFRTETVRDFWFRMGKAHRVYKLGKAVPAPLLSSLAVKRLFKSTNAPQYWLKHGKEGRVRAFFKSREDYEKIPDKWADYNLLCKGKLDDGSDIDYAAYKDVKNADKYLLDHGYDESKPLAELTREELDEAAKFRGGRLISANYDGDEYSKLIWKCREGHEFPLTPYTVLKGGYWCPHCCEPKPWRYGALADIPFYGQVYYDSHDESEVDDSFPLFEHEENFIIKKK